MDARSPDWAHKLVQRHACAARALEHMYTEKNVKRLIEVGAELEAALAALPSDAAQAPQGWIACADCLPKESEHRRVLIYTDGCEFASEQFFDVEADSLNECSYADPEDQPEVCRVASHWMPLPYPSAAPVAPQADGDAAQTPIDYDRVVQICEAHGIGLPVDCVEMVVEIIRHAAPVAPAAAAQPDERTGLETLSKLSTDAVAHLSTDSVDKPVNRMSDTLHENGHQFEKGESLGFSPGSVLYVTYMCRHCGVVRNDEGQNRQCRGRVRITTRDEGNRTPIDGDRITQGK